MRRRYKIRVHESGDRDGATEAGTIVMHIGGSTAVEGSSIEEVEAHIQKQIQQGALSTGYVYQIWPPEGPAFAHSFAARSDGEFRECFLETAQGIYSEYHRIRYSSSIAPPYTPAAA